MIYYSDGTVTVRNLCTDDVKPIVDGEIEHGWDATAEKYEMRLRDQAEGKAISLAAEYCGKVAGYINVYPDSKWGAFANMGLPEIVDFGVLEKYRRRGVGSKMCVALTARFLCFARKMVYYA